MSMMSMLHQKQSIQADQGRPVLSSLHPLVASMIAPQMAFRAFKAPPKVAPWAKLSAQLPRSQPAFRRFFAAVPQEQPRLRLGSTGMFG